MTRDAVNKLGPKRLMWVDIDLEREKADEYLANVVDVLGIQPVEIRRDTADRGRAGLTRQEDRLHLVVEALELDADADRIERREIDLIAEPNVVLTLHEGESGALIRFRDGLEGETRLGALTAGDLLSSLVDEVIDGYFLVAEAIERKVDDLDQRALHGRRSENILRDIVELRGRIGLVRRTIVPHRHALSTLALPEMQVEKLVGRPWPGLIDHLAAAIDAIENLRESLIGTFDIHMSRESQRANDTMRALTLLSAVLLPAVILAGIMGMNFKLGFFDDTANFWIVILGMAALAVTILGVARWRRWF